MVVVVVVVVCTLLYTKVRSLRTVDVASGLLGYGPAYAVRSLRTVDEGQGLVGNDGDGGDGDGDGSDGAVLVPPCSMWMVCLSMVALAVALTLVALAVNEYARCMDSATTGDTGNGEVTIWAVDESRKRMGRMTLLSLLWKDWKRIE